MCPRAVPQILTMQACSEHPFPTCACFFAGLCHHPGYERPSPSISAGGIHAEMSRSSIRRPQHLIGLAATLNQRCRWLYGVARVQSTQLRKTAGMRPSAIPPAVAGVVRFQGGATCLGAAARVASQQGAQASPEPLFARPCLPC